MAAWPMTLLTSDRTGVEDRAGCRHGDCFLHTGRSHLHIDTRCLTHQDRHTRDRRGLQAGERCRHFIAARLQSGYGVAAWLPDRSRFREPRLCRDS